MHEEKNASSFPVQKIEARRREMLDAVSDAVLSIDGDRRIHLANRGAALVFGYAENELTGMLLDRLIAGISHKAYLLYFDEVNHLFHKRAEREASVELYGLQKDGTVFPLAFSLSKRGSGDEKMLTALMKDIAKDKLVEESRRKLEEAKKAAAEAIRTKNAFIANMSHEIRTPLTAIIGFAESILDGETTPAEREKGLEVIIGNGRHLVKVINEILDFSKIEAGKLDLELIPTSPYYLVKELEPIVEMQARGKGLSFEIDFKFPLPERISTDPTRLKQILLNLCGNAIKFSDKGCIKIEVRYDLEKSRLGITVVDPGIGLSEAQRRKIFSPFTQGDSSTTRKYGGTGLGLHICQALANKMWGSITVDSVPGFGSRFSLLLNIDPADGKKLVYHLYEIRDEDKSAAVDWKPPKGLSGRILLAEDNKDNQALISHYIRKTGAELALADNGQMAVEQGISGDFDLILMDMQLPVMDGVEATQWLRKAGYTGPIVALTANVMKEDREKCVAAGCNGFLTKPLDLKAFHEALSQYLNAGPEKTKAAAPGLSPNDPEYRALVADFVGRLPAYLKEIAAAAEAEEWAEAKALAHQLKGLGGGFGYLEMTQVAGQFEFQIAQKAYGEAAKRLRSLRALCERIYGNRT